MKQSIFVEFVKEKGENELNCWLKTTIEMIERPKEAKSPLEQLI